MKTTTLVLTIATLLVALQMTTVTAAGASNTIAEKESVACTTCHDKPGSKLLTSKGKYYELTRKLEGHDQLVATFGPCTNCHVRKPGSAKLTREGRLLRDLGRDMAGLEQWLLERHPAQGDSDAIEELAADSMGTAKTPDGK